MKLKSLLLFMFCLFGAELASAQSDSQAKILLNEVSEKVDSYKNIVLKFDYIQADDERGIHQKTKGTVTLSGRKYKLELMGTIRIFDGHNLYSIIPEDEEINISRYDPSKDDELSPSRMLRFYEQGYSYKMGKKVTVEGRTLQYVDLKPTDASSDIEEVHLGIDAKTKNIYSLTQNLKDGTRLEFVVKSFKVNQPLPKNIFAFDKDKHKGYYINRLD